MKKAIIIYGPPGAGKGTQANLLAWAKGFIHFDTGKYIENSMLYSPDFKNDKIVQRERKNFEAGVLFTPSWTLGVVSKATQKIAQADFSIVYSGSPRTIYEALGDKKNDGLVSILEKEYGKKNIYVLLLKVRAKSSIFRNSNRKVCSVCGTAILYSEETHKHRNCPLCGGKLRTRTLDKPEVIKTRLKEYENRTKPITTELKKRGYKILEIDGEPAPDKVHFAVLKKLKI